MKSQDYDLHNGAMHLIIHWENQEKTFRFDDSSYKDIIKREGA